MSAACQMVHTQPDTGRQYVCGDDIVGITEDGVFVCESCARDHEGEGFKVDRRIHSLPGGVSP